MQSTFIHRVARFMYVAVNACLDTETLPIRVRVEFQLHARHGTRIATIVISMYLRSLQRNLPLNTHVLTVRWGPRSRMTRSYGIRALPCSLVAFSWTYNQRTLVLGMHAIKQKVFL